MDPEVGALMGALRREAEATDERRGVVIAGGRAACERVLAAVAARLPDEGVVVADRPLGLEYERLGLARTERLLGTTRRTVVLDCHDACRPNALGRAVGAVDGGGLFVVVAPALECWPAVRDEFDRGLAVPPADIEDVTGRFRARLTETLRAHRGIAVLDADAGRIEDDGLLDPAPRRPTDSEKPVGSEFPDAAYEACLTGDQAGALVDLEQLCDPPAAVVLTADRGRGKSSGAGLAAASLATRGMDVLVTAPERRNATEVFARADELLGRLGAVESVGDPPHRLVAGDGCVRFATPTTDLPGTPDAVVVDEAAALPVRRLEACLAPDRAVFATTVHGYEGSGRGFDVRFRERLADARHAVTETGMAEPIRYAREDPLEAWAYHALALDARPPVAPLLEGAAPEATDYRAIDRAALAADESRLRETFGLLVAAHYRTEPDDLARVLDAPNVAVRALEYEGHVVSVALLADEGGLGEATRRDIYTGERIRGNMLPDMLASQLRDEDAPALEGVRVLRLATHAAVRSRGLGSWLVEAVREEFTDRDWLGVSYGATPRLVEFWADSGFSTVGISTTRNERSGEHSALMLQGISERGRALCERHGRWFAARAPAQLADALANLDSAVAVAALRACRATVEPTLSERGWRHVAGAAFGPALYDVDPRPFRELAVKQLVDPADSDALSDRERRLLVGKVLQARPGEAVAEELGYDSAGECMRALGDAYKPIVETYGGETVRAERERY